MNYSDFDDVMYKLYCKYSNNTITKDYFIYNYIELGLTYNNFTYTQDENNIIEKTYSEQLERLNKTINNGYVRMAISLQHLFEINVIENDTIIKTEIMRYYYYVALFGLVDIIEIHEFLNFPKNKYPIHYVIQKNDTHTFEKMIKLHNKNDIDKLYLFDYILSNDYNLDYITLLLNYEININKYHIHPIIILYEKNYKHNDIFYNLINHIIFTSEINVLYNGNHMIYLLLDDWDKYNNLWEKYIDIYIGKKPLINNLQKYDKIRAQICKNYTKQFQKDMIPYGLLNGDISSLELMRPKIYKYINVVNYVSHLHEDVYCYMYIYIKYRYKMQRVNKFYGYKLTINLFDADIKYDIENMMNKLSKLDNLNVNRKLSYIYGIYVNMLFGIYAPINRLPINIKPITGEFLPICVYDNEWIYGCIININNIIYSIGCANIIIDNYNDAANSIDKITYTNIEADTLAKVIWHIDHLLLNNKPTPLTYNYRYNSLEYYLACYMSYVLDRVKYINLIVNIK